jgi:MinD-like ATPase involved in chromosome partitioning or flagellar assembly
MAAIVRELARIANYCVLDLGVGLPPATQRAVEQCAQVVVVAEPDPHTMQQTKALLDDLKSIGVASNKILLAMVNRVRTDLAMSAADVQKTLDKKLDAVFTPAPELAFQATRAQTSMLSMDPQSFTAQQTLKLADLIKEPVSR